MALRERFKDAWDAFRGRDPTPRGFYYNSENPSRKRVGYNSFAQVCASIYGRIAVDCSMINVNQVRLDEKGRYKETLNTNLNRALTTEANLDQTGRELIREAVYTMLSEGYVALIPITTDKNPELTDSYDIYEIRVGTIKEWLAKEIRVEIYNQHSGKKEEKVLPKRMVAIIENPFYWIMNEPNSTGKRLMRTLNMLDRKNDDSVSGKLDMIIQLPYTIKTDARRKQAENRLNDIEQQLTMSTHGIAYTDSTENIIQLNKSLTNNLWEQAKELLDQFYNQLGLSKAVFDGTADEAAMLNYTNRTIEPILTALTEEMERKWLSRTAQTQGQAIRFFDKPFRLIPVAQLAELADKFTRNEILTSNEIRSEIGMKPVDDPKADELRNSNLNHPDESGSVNTEVVEDVKIQNEE